MKLAALLDGVTDAALDGDRDVEIAEVRDDSRLVAPGDLFVAVPGTAADGGAFVADAALRGARALVIEGPLPAGRGLPAVEALVPSSFTGAIVRVPSARRALARIAANRFGAARALALTAVTGTNGKTTTTHLVEGVLASAGRRVGVIGTIAYRFCAPGTPGAFSQAAPLTTPGALAFQKLLADMHAAGATDVVLEATSHALDQGRLDGCSFRVAALTNVTQDHLDYHGTMERYFDAKAILFERLLDSASGVAVLPVDLPEGRAMRARVRGPRILAVAAAPGTPGADVVVQTVDMSATGTRARLATPAGPLELTSPMVGDFNLANIVLSVGIGLARGLSLDEVANGVAATPGVPGRLQRIDNARGVLCVVDYAHTPDALERAIAALRPLVAPGGRLIVVFGCGGDRDRTKRPLMGEIAARDGDLAIVTSDNPRTEEPASIVEMVLGGVRRVPIAELDERALGGAARGFHVAVDRRTAIARAVTAARAGDAVLIAGKGHEDYQIVGTARLHFDDREEAAAAFRASPGGAAMTVPPTSGEAGHSS